jgi:hypothetical protein
MLDAGPEGVYELAVSLDSVVDQERILQVWFSQPVASCCKGAQPRFVLRQLP